jgi:hypothetical protein
VLPGPTFQTTFEINPPHADTSKYGEEVGTRENPEHACSKTRCAA